MTYIVDIILIALGAALINNFVLHYFVGICPFVGVSRRIDMAFGMGCAVTFVITIAAFISWAITTFVLVPGAPLSRWIAGFFVSAETAAGIDLTILSYIVYILAISSSVQFVEMYVRKFYPPLYKSFGVYLPLITTNCAILGVALFQTNKGYGFGESLIYALGAGAGFTVALVLMAGLRETLEFAEVPKVVKGTVLTLLIAGILSLTFMGFSGLGS